MKSWQDTLLLMAYVVIMLVMFGGFAATMFYIVSQIRE